MKPTLEPITINTTDQNANLSNYDEAAKEMNWKNIEEHFTWSKTGNVNMVYEAIDRHVTEGKGNKKALFIATAIEMKSILFLIYKRYPADMQMAYALMGSKKVIGYLFLCLAVLNYTYLCLVLSELGQSLDQCLKHLWKKLLKIDY